MKLTITGQVFKNDKKKDGTPFVGKNGRPFTLLSFTVKEEVMGKVGAKLSGFMNEDNANWKDGDVIDVEVKQNGEYLNFELPKKTVGRAEFDALKRDVESIKEVVFSTSEDIPEIEY